MSRKYLAILAHSPRLLSASHGPIAPQASMLFNSTEFIFVFLPLAVLVHFAVARVSATAAILGTTLSSLVFYAWWNPPFVLLPWHRSSRISGSRG